MRSKKGKGNPNTEEPEATPFHLPWEIYSSSSCSGDKISDPAGDLMASMAFSGPSSRDPGVPPQPSPQPQQQWGHDETRDLIGIRGEMEKEDAVFAKGNASNTRKETFWETVSWRMRERGHFRTPEQCQYKWKNLVRRYKGKETSNSESGQPFPFFEELHSVIAERVQFVESEAGSAHGRKKVKLGGGDGYSAEFSGGDCDIEGDSVEEKPIKSNSKKRKGKKPVTVKPSSMRSATDISSNDAGCINKLLKEFLQQQHKTEIEWMEMMEKSARERELFEQEWRQSMEKLERERLMIEQAWREREEERRIREENRAERRDALLTTLLNQLIHEKSL